MKSLVRVTLVVLVAAAMASCSKAPPEFEYTRVSVNGEPTLGIARKGVPARGVVIFFHGLDSSEYALIADEPHKQLTDTLLDAGFAVIASKAGGNAYGNASSQTSYRELAKVALEHYRVSNVFLLAESMGAIAAVNLLASGDPLAVRGLAAISPVMNLANPPSEHRAAIAASFPDASIAAVNPIKLPAERLRGKKLRLYATPEDSLVSTETNALAFEARFGPVAEVSVVSCSGPHLDPSCIQGDDIVKWFTRLESDALS